MAPDGARPSLHFINETSVGDQTSKATAESKRRIVRSQAMIAVRRRQRLATAAYLQLRWTAPKIGARTEAASDGGGEGDDMKKVDAQHFACKYDFVEEGDFKVSKSREMLEHDAAKSTSRPPGPHKKEPKDKNPPPTEQVGVLEGNALCTPRPIEKLGGGRRNPFDTYPIPLSEEVNELMDHCKSYW